MVKAVYNLPTTRALLDRLACDKKLRRICGWEQRGEVPSESTFSRAFDEFSESQLPAFVHQTMILEKLSDDIISHISWDSTEIEAREKPPKATKAESASGEKIPKRKLGRPKKGEEPMKVQTRLERQQNMTVEEMLDDLPRQCDVGTKKNSKGHKGTWKRKLIWLGTHSYLFRNSFRNYIEDHGGKPEIPIIDDFVCQKTTSWSGLGVIDILASILDISEEQRLDLRSWYERHQAYYRILTNKGHISEVVNIMDAPVRN